MRSISACFWASLLFVSFSFGTFADDRPNPTNCPDQIKAQILKYSAQRESVASALKRRNQVAAWDWGNSAQVPASGWRMFYSPARKATSTQLGGIQTSSATAAAERPVLEEGTEIALQPDDERIPVGGLTFKLETAGRSVGEFTTDEKGVVFIPSSDDIKPDTTVSLKFVRAETNAHPGRENIIAGLKARNKIASWEWGNGAQVPASGWAIQYSPTRRKKGGAAAQVQSKSEEGTEVVLQADNERVPMYGFVFQLEAKGKVIGEYTTDEKGAIFIPSSDELKLETPVVLKFVRINPV